MGFAIGTVITTPRFQKAQRSLDRRDKAFAEGVIAHSLAHALALAYTVNFNDRLHDDQITSANSSSMRLNMQTAASKRTIVTPAEIARPLQLKERPKIASRKPSMIPLRGLSLSTHCQRAGRKLTG